MSSATLTATLALVSGWLRGGGNGAALAAAEANDPLRLDLPPLLGTGQQATITASALRGLAALYLHAELEQTGVLLVAEALAEARDRLPFLSVDAARKLDELARDKADWDGRRREALFARLFGFGGRATRESGPVNDEFLQTFVTLCAELVRYEWEDRVAGAPGATREAQLRFAASAVLYNLAPRHSGLTTLAAAQIQRQIQRALAVLGERSLMAQFRAQSAWDVVRAVIEGSAPDIGRIVRRGQTGVRVFEWLASVMADLGNGTAGAGRLVPRNAPVFTEAAQWLEATGLSEITAARKGAGALAP